MKPYKSLIFLLTLAVCFGTLWAGNAAKRKGVVKVPARIHVSGNFEGELEPCG